MTKLSFLCKNTNRCDELLILKCI